MNLRETKLYKKLDTYIACSYAEGFCEGANATEQEQLIAWQYIYDKKLYSGLQGWYGRTCESLLKNGYIDR